MEHIKCIYINKKEIKSTPFQIEVTPTIIDADKCLNEPLSSNIVNSWENITIQYQCRDICMGIIFKIN